METKTKLIIIGGGPGGYKTAEYAAGQGLDVTLIEKGYLGGTCLNTGCIPTKALLHDANENYILTRYGLASSDDNHYFEKAIQRKAQIVEQLRNGVSALMAQKGVKVIEGEAILTSSETVTVGHDTLTADHIIIATGSINKTLDIENDGSIAILQSDDILCLSSLPQSICIIGAGVIGMEMATMLSQFGTKVTVVEYLDECLPSVDKEVAKRTRKMMEKQGITFMLNTAVTLVKDGVVHCHNHKKNASVAFTAEKILMAVGRKPSLNVLNTASMGVAYTDKGITTDENLQTTLPHVYAIGDVNGRSMLAHSATFQGYRAINHIIGKKDTIRLDLIPAAVFTTPEIGTVGPTEESLKALSTPYTVHKVIYRSSGRAMAMDKTDGMVKILCDTDGKIIACHACGADAAWMAQEICVLINMDTHLDQLANIVHIHPTLAELLQEAAM